MEMKNVNIVDQNPQPTITEPPPAYGTPQGVTVSAVTVLPGPSMMVTTPPQLGTEPQPFTCPSCNTQIVTNVEYKSTTRTHLFALLLCCLGGCCCAWIPYCMKSCRNADHYCPECQAYLGTYAQGNR